LEEIIHTPLPFIVTGVAAASASGEKGYNSYYKCRGPSTYIKKQYDLCKKI